MARSTARVAASTKRRTRPRGRDGSAGAASGPGVRFERNGGAGFRARGRSGRGGRGGAAGGGSTGTAAAREAPQMAQVWPP
jgi:hypothetical protein